MTTTPIDPKALRRQLTADPQSLRLMLDRMVEQSAIQIPPDYGPDLAFPAVCRLARAASPEHGREQLGRLAVYFHSRLADPNEVELADFSLAIAFRDDYPDDYDLDTAFADVLSIGILDTDPELHKTILPLALWMFERLQKGDGQ